MNKKIFNIISTFFSILLISILSSTIVFLNCYDYHPVNGSSMEPTISEENSAVYTMRSKKVERFDIVVAKSPHGTNVIKRAIGFEGEKIGFWETFEDVTDANGEVFSTKVYKLLIIKNGETIVHVFDEEYLSSPTINQTTYTNLINSLSTKNFITTETCEWKDETQSVKVYNVPTGSLFILGDNRKVSQDSSSYGAINIKTNLIGKVRLLVHDDMRKVFEVIWSIISFSNQDFGGEKI